MRTKPFPVSLLRMSAPLPESAIQTAADNLRDALLHAFEHTAEQPALVVWDAESELSIALTEAYRRCLPRATFIQFETTEPEAVLAAFEQQHAGDLVVLIQSTNFRLASFRIRLELFRRDLKVIEHPHLSRIIADERLVYIESLAYDPAYYRGTGRALQERISRAAHGVIDSGGAGLVFPAGFEPAKVNIGDYTGMQNIGGQYPIGEVFTESADLEAVHGRVRIGFFGDTTFRVNRPPSPITLVVEGGRITGALDSTPEFETVLANIRADEGEVWLRELGFGMNRAFTHERTVSDIGTFERMCGIHLSIGAKHASYNKPNIRKKAARHHVDVFVITKGVALDGEELYRDGAWVV